MSNEMKDYMAETNEELLQAAEDLHGLYPLGVAAGLTADEPLRLVVLELRPSVSIFSDMIYLNQDLFKLYRPFTLDERDAREYQNVSCHGIDVESDSGQVWVLDDVTAWLSFPRDGLNRISSAADTLCPDINYSYLSRIKVPDNGVKWAITLDTAEELLDSFALAGLQKVEPEVVKQGRESCIWNTRHTSLNSAMDFYEEVERAAARGEER